MLHKVRHIVVGSPPAPSSVADAVSRNPPRPIIGGVPPEPRRNPIRPLFTVVVEQVAANGFDLRVPELPGTWTVAFDRDEIEARARTRIALDTGHAVDEFDVSLQFPPFHVERRANRRP